MRIRAGAALLFFSMLLLSAEERIASLSPNLTEIICLLGGESALCGRSSACDYPPGIRKIPVVGRFGKADPEALIASGATVVVTAAVRSPNDRAVLERAGIRYLEIPANSLSDYDSALRTLGELLGKRERAEQEIRKNREEIRRFRSDLPQAPKVFVMISSSPLYTAGKRTFLHELIELAGGKNIAGEEEKGYFIVSPEWVLLRDPDIVVFCGGENETESVLRSCSAFRSGRILTGLDPSLLYRLGPRSMEAVRKLHDFFRQSGNRTGHEK